MLKEKDIMDKLRLVMDPELGINIVELGLIYDVKVEGKTKEGRDKATVKMTFTTPACPMVNHLISEVKRRLDELGDGVDITVDIVFDPPWTPDRMSEKAKALLGYG